MKIKSIKSVGMRPVWDIRVENDHSYISKGGYINHNSSDPNVQNIPKEARGILIARPDHSLITADFSQYEFRAAAAITGEQYLIDTFNERYEMLPLINDIASKYSVSDPDHLVKEVTKGKIKCTQGESEKIRAFSNLDIHRRNAALVLKKDISQIDDDDRSIGKAQPLTAKVLTKDGWKLMGELSIGELVVTPSGELASITNIYPQGIKPRYEVILKDGIKTECCPEHLWEVQTWEKRNKVTKIVDTNWIKENLKRKESGRSDESNVFLSLITPYKGEDKELPIDPYLLGCWLGDGNVTLGRDVSITVGDSELLTHLEKVLTDNLTLKLSTVYSKRTPSYRITRLNAPLSRQEPSMFQKLNHLGLQESKSWNKFIPKQYLDASYNQRVELLQGLMDTDGTVDKKGIITFTSVSKLLAENVADLVRSLGGRASMWIKKTTHRDAYNVWIALPAINPFKLSRKANRVKVATKRSYQNTVIAVNELEPIEMQCIEIDHPSHLYITDNYIPTHNTLGYALLYGSGPATMLQQLFKGGVTNIKLTDCMTYREVFMSQLVKIAAFIEETHERVIDPGYIETILGRKRWFSLCPKYMTARYERELADAQREAVNWKFQASNADATKLAMVQMSDLFLTEFEEGYQPYCLLNVHDETVTEVHDSVLEEAQTIILNAMIDAGNRSVNYGVPIESSISIGKRWTK